MMSRTIAILAGAVALRAGAAYASPDTHAALTTLENRAQLVAARMSHGESYDQATRAVPQVSSDERSQAIFLEMGKGSTYRQAKLTISERPAVVNARWTKHQTAMQLGGSHEAGWAASTRE